MLPLPHSLKPIELADWLELYALLSPDGNSSAGDLEFALRLASYSGLTDGAAIERKIEEVFAELERRQHASGDAYPFEVDFHGVIQLRDGWERFPVYAFCLCLSYLGSTDYSRTGKLFEQISCYTIENYLQADAKAVGFGAPRQDLPASFAEAVDRLCDVIGEGEGYCMKPSLARKDDKLDLLAWRHFPDERSGKMLIFGQCASGANWRDKLTELVPNVFCNLWMLRTPVSPMVKALFVPHHVDQDEWDYVVAYSGILFDRCRIAFWAPSQGANYGPHVSWVRESLAQVAL